MFMHGYTHGQLENTMVNGSAPFQQWFFSVFVQADTGTEEKKKNYYRED